MSILHEEASRESVALNDATVSALRIAVPESVPNAGADASAREVHPGNILNRCSLLGYASELEATMQAQRPFMGSLALTGQATVWYAAPNTGKTLLAIHLMIEAVERGEVEPSNIYYIAADDTANGLVEKLHILEEYGVHVVAPGHRGFETSKFVAMIARMTKDDAVNGLCVVADTVKKFVSLMDKGEARKFGDTIRQFVLKGGTFVGLAHTNKNRDSNGKLVYSGTTDIVEDIDCAYVIDEIPSDDDGRKVVSFQNIKRRGNVADKLAYSYATEAEQSFGGLLASVCEVGAEELAGLHLKAELRSDASIIEAIERSIHQRIDSKMHIAKSVGPLTKASRQQVVTILERYTGDDPAVHRWTFSVAGHGKRVYVLLDKAPALAA